MIPELESYPDYYEQGMPGYVLRDWEVVDYECFKLDGTDLWFRGPAPKNLEPKKYFSAIGAAQTFGCFCPHPYPTILSRRLGTEALNLGYAGAGPSFFLQNPRLLEYVNQSTFCIVQIMSGRSVSNSILENPDGLGYAKRTSDGVMVSAETAFEELLARETARIPIGSRRLKRAVLKRFPIPIPSVRRIVKESQSRWLQDYRALMEAIVVPKILFWFSKRGTFYVPKYHSRTGVFGAFPQLVNSSMVREIRHHADRYVSCVSRRGMPQPLISRFTGDPTTIDLSADNPLYNGVIDNNTYYPSPQMQDDAANALETVCGETLASASKRTA